MGSICHINPEPKTWPAYDSGKKTKLEFGGEPLIHIQYGVFDDDPGGAMDMTMLMRDSIYHKLTSGMLQVSPDSSRLRRLIIIDADGKPVKPLGSSVY